MRKDGITYPQYVAELTYLLFLKMESETGLDGSRLPFDLSWQSLLATPPAERLNRYRRVLHSLADENQTGDAAVSRIFLGATTVLREPRNLDMLVEAIEKLVWFSTSRDSFGDLYEGLLQKNAEETKRGAGQYFTPRVVTDVIIELVKPLSGELVQDPAAGTGGFLIGAAAGSGKCEGASRVTVSGMENVADTFRLLLMNLYLHGVDASHVHHGDTLSEDYRRLPQADVILTNPPFGPAGGRPSRADLTITAAATSYQLPFVEHCVRALKPGGRAAIVIPDNVLFEGGRASDLRRSLLDQCDLHTILRLPTGIFYAQGVRTNVLFLTKASDAVAPTRGTWIYDMRANMPAFGKTNPLTADQFEDFTDCFGSDPYGSAARQDEGELARFRYFSREFIAQRNDDLNISWLRDDSDDAEVELVDPEDIAAAILGHLRAAIQQIEGVAEELDPAGVRLSS